MNAKAKTTPTHLSGIRRAMEPFGIRFPPDEADILRKTAKKSNCKCADLVRTAWLEYIDNHELWKNLPAKKAK